MRGSHVQKAIHQIRLADVVGHGCQLLDANHRANTDEQTKNPLKPAADKHEGIREERTLKVAYFCELGACAPEGDAAD